MEKISRGTRLRCVELPFTEVKGSPILKHLKLAILVFKDKLTWIPGSGKSMKIWEDRIYEKEKLSSREDLAPLKEWMEDQNIQTLYDISAWDESTENWVGWNLDSPPNPLTPLVSSLVHALSGCYPWNRYKKDSLYSMCANYHS